MMIKHTAIILLALLLCLSLPCGALASGELQTASAAEESTAEMAPAEIPTEENEIMTEDGAEGISGTCGENLTWTLSADGVLTISGTGAMTEYHQMEYYQQPEFYPPWNDYSSQISEVVIENGVTSISQYAFYQYTALSQVTISDSVTTIGDACFCGCSKLTEVTIPDSVTSVGIWGFGNCTSLTKINIPDSITKISQSEFCGCSSLKEISIPETVTSIDSWAFQECTGLNSIYIPASVTEMGKQIFYGNYNSQFIIYCGAEETPEGWETRWNYTDRTVIYGIPEEENEYWQSLDPKAESITISDNITCIPSHAFQNCTNLTEVTIPDTVTDISETAFAGCSALTELNISTDLAKAVGHSGSCGDDLRWILVGGVLKITGEGDMYESSNLSYLDYKDIIYIVLLPDGITGIGSGAFAGCTELTKIDIPESVASIGSSVFSGCIGLTEITLPAHLTVVGQGAFYQCSSLNSITFTGKAPILESGCMSEITATCYYPAGVSTWTDDIKRSYGGNITWNSYESEYTEPTATHDPTPTETPVPTEEPVSSLKGDMNEDGKVNIVDALRLFRYVNGQIPSL